MHIQGLDQEVNDAIAAQTNSKLLVILIRGIVGDENGFLLKDDCLCFAKCISFETAPTNCPR